MKKEKTENQASQIMITIMKIVTLNYIYTVFRLWLFVL